MPSYVRKSGATLRGWTEMSQKLKNFAKKYPKVVGRALRDELKIEMKESMRRTPVATGALRDSHELLGPEYGPGTRIAASISVGANLEYAVRVHEMVELHHRVGQAKFLESTLMESARFMNRRIAERIRFKTDMIV